ncbi:MAG TPA: hypothetical protein VIV60_34280, partial [Polyangiaceae bacterium]
VSSSPSVNPKLVRASSPDVDAKPAAPPVLANQAHNSDLDTATAPQPAVVVSLVIAIEDTLDLQEIPVPSESDASQSQAEHRVGVSDVPPPLPEEAQFPSVDEEMAVARPAVFVTEPAEPGSANLESARLESVALGTAPITNEAKVEPVADIKRSSSSDLRESASLLAAHVRAPSSPNLADTRPSQGALSLDAGYAVEFFSSAPPPSRPAEVEILTEFDPALRHVRSEEQLARQAYLRGVVLKVMLIAIVFVAIVVYMLWHRGLLRVAG